MSNENPLLNNASVQGAAKSIEGLMDTKGVIKKTQEMQLDFEAKIKEMALKYNTQLDTAKIKADADLDNMMVAGDNKILEEAAKSTNMFGKQLQGIHESERPGGQVGGNQPIQRSQADIRE